MAISVARKKANRKWDEANRDRYWQCPLRFSAADKQAVVARAAALGVPVSEYIPGTGIRRPHPPAVDSSQW